MSAWIELFRGKCSIYALDEISKEWVDRGLSGQLIMLQNNQFRPDIHIKWTKNQREIWWRLLNVKLKPKGERAWVLKAWDTSNNKQEILAIRFSDVSLSQQFSTKFHQIFPQQQQNRPPPIHQQHFQQQQQQQTNYHHNHQQPSYSQGQYMMGMNNMNNMMPMNHGMMNMNAIKGMNNMGNMYVPNDGYNGYQANNNNNNQYNNNNNNMNNINNKTWECAVCTYSNDMNKQSCIMCGLSQHSTQKVTIDPSLSHHGMMLQSHQHSSGQNGGFFNNAQPPHTSVVPNNMNNMNNMNNASSFNFQQNALEAMQEQSQSQQRILAQFDANQMNASAVTSPHRKHSNSWNCPMCTLQNSVNITRCDACNASRNIKKEQPPQLDISAYEEKQKQKHAATVQEFQQSASDIACYNDNPSQVFVTLRSVAKKLLKDDVRYRTLDTTNPRVMEKLIGFEGVLDFLMLLGFESDPMGMKLICEQKPTQQIVRNAIEVLNTYERRLGLGRNKNNRNKDESSYITLGNDKYDDDDEQKDTLTLEQIIIWSTHENMSDNDTMETLMLTHKQFTTSLTLLQNLRRRFNVPIPNDIKNDENKINEFRLNVQKRIQLKVIKTLRDWMKQFWDKDFLNDLKVQKELILWLKELEELKNNECPWIAQLSSVVNNEYERFKLQSPNKQRKLQFNPETGIPIFLERVQIKKGYKLSTTTAEDLADEITLIDYRIFSQIEERECIGQCWKKKKVESPNVLLMIQQFNNLVIFIQLQILSEKSLKDRSKAIKRVIKMGERFKYLKNYNSLCAIVGALNSTPIHRLKLAWKRVSEKQLNLFESFKQIFINTKSFKNFRTAFRNVSPPAIPYFGLFLQDLVGIDEGNDQFKTNDDFKKHGFMVNFNKCVRTMDRIKNIRLYQINPYNNIKSKHFLQKLLYQEFHKMKDYTEDMIWDLSNKVKKADESNN